MASYCDFDSDYEEDMVADYVAVTNCAVESNSQGTKKEGPQLFTIGSDPVLSDYDREQQFGYIQELWHSYGIFFLMNFLNTMLFISELLFILLFF